MTEPLVSSRYRRIPGATYRVQFNRQFTFSDALAAADYWSTLGITDCYASPLFLARTESTHGYDVCGFGRLNPELGSRADFDQFAARLRSLDLGLLLDMVPNHMGNELSNDWWRSVLELGTASPHAGWFDIHWHPDDRHPQGCVVLPVLEAPYSQVLEAGKLRVGYHESRLSLHYGERPFPLSPASIARLASEWLSEGVDLATGPKPSAALDELLDRLNGYAGKPRSFDRLHDLLCEQHYRLAFWRIGPEELNYRRFFDVTDLVSLRMERPEVFDAAHQLVFDLIKAGIVTGLRIDHPDGLWDPKQYLERLQSRYRQITPEARPDALYVVVEKILMQGEALPADWPVAGTTGYDFLNELNRLFVEPAHREAFSELYHAFLSEPVPFCLLVRRCKQQILETSLISELDELARQLKRLAQSTRYGQDLSFRQLHSALAGIIAAFPVYRTYTTEHSTPPSIPEATNHPPGDPHRSRGLSSAGRGLRFCPELAPAGLARGFGCRRPGEGAPSQPPVSTVDWAGHGQGHGGYGVLPL